MKLCTGRPRPGVECADPGNVKSLGATAVSLLSGLFHNKIAQSQKHPAVGRRERAAVRKADAYIAARMNGRTQEVLGMVSEDVQLTSSRDGKVAGKRGFRAYLERVPPSGTWERAFWNFEQMCAEVRGRVKVFVVRVDVVARFGFDGRGKIKEIYVGTKR